jgi:HlyD family secretion protein
MIMAGIAILPFVSVDVSVQARGYFQSDIEKQVVYTPIQGKINYISIRNGEKIKKGDTLLVIETETIRAKHASLVQRIAENDSSMVDLEKLTKLYSADTRNLNTSLITQRYKAEFANLRIQQSIQFQKYQKKKTEHERNELLYHQQIIPKMEYENSLFLLNSEKDNLNQVLLSQKSIWQNDLTLRRNESVTLLADLKQCSEELTNRIVLAPTGGEIIQSSDIQTGSIVSPGQKIAEISPEGELVATCFVKPSDIGLIHEKQKVKIQVDAFNFNEWGMLQGEIIDISDDMILENGSVAYFRIKCKPEKTFLSLKNGYKADIKKGMSLSTRIVVIRRSLFHLLFDKADKWFNPYTYVKE